MIEINIGVHELVDFILRSGDIDDRYFNNETMQKGTALHLKYQEAQGIKYESEVYLKRRFDYKEYSFTLSGRCDGIIKNKIPEIDEIKSTNLLSLEEFYEKNKEWHLGQVEIYALIYLLNNDLDRINVRLTYLSQIYKSKKLVKKFKYTKDELLNKVNDYFEKYIIYLKEDHKYNDLLNESLKNLVFPYENPRKGQIEISNIVNESIENNKITFIEAATGIGKTISVLYGALFGLKNKKINRIFYLTAKNSGFLSVIEQVKKIKENNLTLRTCIIYSKEKSCISNNKKKKCNPEDCVFAKNYYSKLNAAILDCLQNDYLFDYETILKYALKYEICPFEFSLDLSKLCTLIVCDYNYVFHPISYLKSYFDSYDNESKDYNICYLIDEAHNLINRSREMYSSKISLSDIKKALKEIDKSKNLKQIKNNLNVVKKHFESIKNTGNKVIEVDLLETNIYDSLNKINDLSKDFKRNNYLKESLNIEDLLLKIYQFITIYKICDEKFKIYYEIENNDVTLNVSCLDSSSFINKILYNRPAILFSGTLTPINYFKKITLGSEDYENYSFDSPYDENNLKILIDSSISLYFKDRDNTMKSVVNEIFNFISYKIGNYLIYLPSFKYINDLKEYFKDLNYNFFFQDNNSLNKIEEKDFFMNFFKNNNQMNIAFCVLGGSYSEGVDIKNNMLNGICIVGVGLPSINYKNELLNKYFNDLELNGFNFAYTNPGINKVIQAIGRLIRNEKDKGIVLLIDKRYSFNEYKQIFNKKFKNIENINKNNINYYLKEFYKI